MASSISSVDEKIKETFTGKLTEHGFYVIKTYMPNPGKEKELENVLKTHWESLHASGLTTGQQPYFLKNKAGRILEIFAWKDKDSMDKAHNTESTKKTWETIMGLSTLVPLASLTESSDLYASFQMICPKTHQTMPTMVQIVCQKPHQGKENEYLKKLATHDKALRDHGFATDRPAMHMKAEKQGHMLEICEWKSQEKVQEALKSETISNLWNEFQNIAETTLLKDLPEAKERYSLFPAVSI